MSELKPCPFCGEKPLRKFHEQFQKWGISCENPKCNIQPMTALYKHKGQDLRAWNTRTPQNDEVRI